MHSARRVQSRSVALVLPLDVKNGLMAAVKRFATRLLFCVHVSAGCAGSLTATATAGAADAVDDASRGTARKLGYQGVAAYQAGDYRTASEKLEKAYGVLRVPSLGLWSARALVKLGKLVEGSERYAQVAQLGASTGNEAVQKRALADAESELSLLNPKIPSVVVRIEGAPPADVQVQIDGVPIARELLGEARPVNPGPHKIEGQRGTEQAVVELSLAESEQKPALLRFQSRVAALPPAGSAATPPPAPSSDSPRAGLGQQRTLALIAGGVGVVGLGVGAVFGFKSKANHDEAAKYCQGSECTDERGVSAGTDAHAAGNVSTIAMVVGGVGLASAAVLWFTAPQASQAASARLGVGVGSLQVRGQF